MPLIENKALLSWLVRSPTELEHARSRKIKPMQMSKLEEVWKQRPSADLADLTEQ